MNLTKKITKALLEATMYPNSGDEDVTTVYSDQDSLDTTLKDINTVKRQSGGDYDVSVVDEAVVGSATVEYLKDKEGEVPFTINGVTWEYVWGKYPNGKTDIAVYRKDQDMAYSYPWFRKEVLGDESYVDTMAENIGDDYESSSRGADKGEAGEEDYEELQKLKQQAMEENKNVVGKMTKGNLEKLIEAKVTPKKHIIKIGDIRK